MAERRMFAKTIVLSDAFLDMPLSARCLYFTLGMLADDDGFVNSPKSIMRQCGAGADDMNILIAKRFLLAFEDGVIVIKHWRINNYLRSDRYQETKYSEKKALLDFDENGAYRYTDGVPDGIPLVSTGKDRLGKDSIGKGNNNQYSLSPNIECVKKHFTPPTLEEVTAYCNERKNNIDAQHFIDYYSSNGWKVGKNPMKDWKAAIRTWERNGYSGSKTVTDTLPHDPELDKLFGD